MKKKSIPYQIRRYFLILGISLGVVIGYVIAFIPLHTELFFFIVLMILVGLFVHQHNSNYDLFKEWGLIEKEK